MNDLEEIYLKINKNKLTARTSNDIIVNVHMIYFGI